MSQLATSPIAKRWTYQGPEHGGSEFHPFRPAVVEPAPQEQLPLSPERFASERAALLALRERLRGNVVQAADGALAGSIEATSASPDAADLALETVEQDIALSLLGSASVALDQIDAALKRMDDGCYGRCEECEKEIPPARLEAIPYANCCVQCAARRERAG